MRVLFTSYAEKTHFFTMVPLAWALRTAGHDVRVASQPELVDAITSTGLPAVPVGRDHGISRVLAAFPRLREKIGEGKLPPFDRADAPDEDLTWDYLRSGFDDVVLSWFRIMNDPMVEDLVGFARSWRPDLVIWEPGTFAAPIAAEAVGAVHARLLWCVDFYGRTRSLYTRLRDQQPPGAAGDALATWLDRTARRHGARFSETMTHGHFTIDQLPPSLRMNTGYRYVPMRHSVFNGRSVIPPWLWAPPERPRVCLTLGMSATERLAGYSVSVGELVESLAELDAEIVATVAEKEQDALGTLPDNVRVESFVPLHALLPHCDAVVHHGGFGSTFTAIASGTPQVAIPQQLDAPFTARRLAAQGAGIHLTTAQATGDRVRDAVTRLLTDPAYQRGTDRLRAEMMAQPTPNALVPSLEALVAEHTGARTAAPVSGPVAVREV
ncbi:glycosyl transferase [Nocardiopsis terrae]|uniref:Glycosyltransferase (Activator-dependent family) n=1 Tax=Nocardiopsis terrae TaxID=372655 RepID=A0ABR9HAA3_9ACTN|nr:activator-dependent family glycosyltransferase [Nocardiopsis terrae]MBE1455975.1 glycosyltransferase (activator-dependent family) [Nocardiopsis terrae]GHC96420.1 glycosyl transferase [Nocardiopsis terrae]